MAKLLSPMTFYMQSAKDVLVTARTEIGKDQEKKKEIIGQIKLLNGAIKTIEKVEKTVNGYSNSWNIFYRIWNAVKACFGMSDWQCAKRSLSQLKNEAAKEFGPEIRAAFGMGSIDSKDKKITSLFNLLFSKSTEEKVLSSLADAALYAMIGINKNKTIRDFMNIELNDKLTDKQKEEMTSKLNKEAIPKEMLEKDFFKTFNDPIERAIGSITKKPDLDD